MDTKQWPDLIGIHATIKRTEGFGAVCWIQGPIDHIVKLQLLTEASFSILDASGPQSDSTALALGRIVAGYGMRFPVSISSAPVGSTVTITQMQDFTWEAGSRIIRIHAIEAGDARARLYELGERVRPGAWVDFENATTNDLILTAVGNLALGRRDHAACVCNGAP